MSLLADLLIFGAIGVFVASLFSESVRQALPRLARRLGDSVRGLSDWQRVGLVLLAALAALFVFQAPLLPAVVVLAALVLFGLAWLREFASLMKLGDDAFPGRNDKLIWALLLIVLFPVGPFVFWSYRRAHWPEAPPADDRAAHDLS